MVITFYLLPWHTGNRLFFPQSIPHLISTKYDCLIVDDEEALSVSTWKYFEMFGVKTAWALEQLDLMWLAFGSFFMCIPPPLAGEYTIIISNGLPATICDIALIGGFEKIKTTDIFPGVGKLRPQTENHYHIDNSK